MSRSLFAEDFDFREPVPEDVPRSVAAAEISPDVVPLAEHHSKCARAWAEGQKAGVAAARADQHAKVLATLGNLEDAIAAMHDAWLAEARTIAEGLAGLLCGCLASAFPQLCANHGEAEVKAIVADILPELAQEPDVALHIAASQAMTVTSFLDGADRKFARVRVVPDAVMPEGDFRLEWSRGEARRDARDVWNRIATILALQGLIQPGGVLTEPKKEAVDVD
jgi:hypothetical protein